jgi:carboxymethylenebutenolidase
MADDQRGMLTYDGEAGPVQAYLARPRNEEPRPAVIVIHEIVGLTDHIKGVADRFAAEGYVAFAPNLFSRPGLAEVLTPTNVTETMRFMTSVGFGRISDRAYIQQAISQLPTEQRETVQRVLPVMFGGIPKDKLTQDLVQAIAYLNAQSFVQTGKIASVASASVAACRSILPVVPDWLRA